MLIPWRVTPLIETPPQTTQVFCSLTLVDLESSWWNNKPSDGKFIASGRHAGKDDLKKQQFIWVVLKKRKTIIIQKKWRSCFKDFFCVNPIHLVFELHLFWPSAHATLKKGLKKLRVTSPRNPTSHFPMWTKERATLLGKNTRLFQVNGVFSKEKRALLYCKNLRVKFNVSDWHDAF